MLEKQQVFRATGKSQQVNVIISIESVNRYFLKNFAFQLD